MAFFGDEFIDVLSVIRVTTSPDSPVELTAVRLAALHAAINRVVAPSNSARGAIVYFAPGTYTIRRDVRRAFGPWEGDLVLPPRAVAWFESGAALRLDGAARVVLSDAVVAPLRQIFFEGDEGMVVLGGALPGVHPEWWGATGEPDHDDADAIQRAIDAASVRRQPYLVSEFINGAPSTGRFRRPLPVLFQQRYSVARELILGKELGIVADPPEVPVPMRSLLGFGVRRSVATTLRGLVAGAALPSAGLHARVNSTESFLGRSMLKVLYSTGSIIEHLAFDGGGSVACNLSIESVRETSGQSITVRGCSFRGATSVQLRIGQESRPAGTAVFRNPDTGHTLYREYRAADLAPVETSITDVPVELEPYSGGDLVGLLVQRCEFEVGTERGAARGIEVRASNMCPGRIVDCRFRGDASTFIDAVAGMALIEGCHFDNRKVPTARGALMLVEQTVTEVINGREVQRVESVRIKGLGFEPPDASDVYLREDVFPSSEEGGLRPSATYPAAVALVGCSSRSFMLFDTVRPSTAVGARPTRSVLILGNLHAPPSDRTVPSIPSVRWGRASRTAPASGFVPSARQYLSPEVAMNGEASLAVVGCSLATGVRVYAGAAQSAVVATVAPGRSPGMEVRFEQTRPGFSAKTLVFGLPLRLTLLMAVLLGCSQSGSTAATDAGLISDIVRVTSDVSDPADTLVVDDLQPTDAVEPTADLVAMSDAGVPDIGPRRISDFGPARQMRRSCPAATNGDPSIPAPRLLFPTSTMRVTSQRPTLDLALPAGVDGARVELCHDPCCNRPIATVDATGGHVRPTEALPPGVVFWRARGRIGDRVGREVSFTWEFGVRHRDTPTDTAWGVIKDINGDGFDDVVTAFQGVIDAAMQIYWGGSDLLHGSRLRRFGIQGTSLAVAVGDYNGDGLADIAVDSYIRDPINNRALLTMAYGEAGGVRVERGGVEIGHSLQIGSSDYNGDGYSDLVVRDFGVREYGRQRVVVLYGGEAGVGAGGVSVVEDPIRPTRYPGFGVTASPGDLDGDGFADLVVADWSAQRDGRVRGLLYAYRGGAGGVVGTDAARFEPLERRFTDTAFGRWAWAIGDINGDRIGDVMVGELYPGAVNVYLGDRRGLLTAGVSLDTPEPENNSGFSFGSASGPATDVDGDGVGEVMIGCAACEDWPDAGVQTHYGRAYFFRWAMPMMESRERLRGVSLNAYDYFGMAVAGAHDLNADGYDDVVVGDVENRLRQPRRGILYIYRGGPEPLVLRALTVTGDAPPPDTDVGIGSPLAIAETAMSGASA